MIRAKWEGILLIVIFSLITFGIVLSKIPATPISGNVANPLTVTPQSVWDSIWIGVGEIVSNIFEGIF